MRLPPEGPYTKIKRKRRSKCLVLRYKGAHVQAACHPLYRILTCYRGRLYLRNIHSNALVPTAKFEPTLTVAPVTPPSPTPTQKAPTLTAEVVPPPTTTTTPTPTPTAAPTANPTPDSTATAEPSVDPIVPFPRDAAGALAALPPSETACLTQRGFFEALATVFDGEDVEPADLAGIVECLSDETLLRMMVTGTIDDIGPFSPATTSCLRAAVERIDLGAAFIYIARGEDEPWNDADANAVVVLTWACQAEDEFGPAAPMMGLTAKDKEVAACMLNELGGSEGILETYDEGGGEDLIAWYLLYTVTCRMDERPPASSGSGPGAT